MRRFIHARHGVTTAIACAAAVAAAAGAAFAATGGFDTSAQSASSNRIYACVTSGFHTLNLTTAGATCPNGQQKISWNVVGPKGPRGNRGSKGARGASGKPGGQGSQGQTGPQGDTGSAGAAGPQGPAGAAGSNGTNGINGVTGPTGAPGQIGPTGPAGTLSSAYLAAYDSLSTTISPGANVLFNTLQASSGITSSGAGNTTFTVGSAGEYQITDGVAGNNQGLRVQLEVNGVNEGPLQTLDASNLNGLSGGFSIVLSLNAGDAITLVNISSAGLNDDPGTYMTIVRIA